MEWEVFVERFAEAVRKNAGEPLGPRTRFRDLPEWDSIAAVCTAAMVLSEYDIELSGPDLEGSETLGDLFETLKAVRSRAAR